MVTTIIIIMSSGSGHSVSALGSRLCDLGKPLNLSDPQSPPLQHGTKNILVERLRDEVRKVLAQCQDDESRQRNVPSLLPLHFSPGF